MATCRQVITTALRKARQIGAGDSPSADDATDTLASLQSYYDECIGLGVFGVLTDVLVTDAYTAGENERIANEVGSNVTITLPEFITDALTRQTRSPRDRALVVIRGDPLQAYLYSAPRGAWDALTGLTLASFAPLSDRSLDGLAALLALRMIEEFGGQVGPATQRAAATFLSLLSHGRDSQRVATQAEYF